MAVAFLSLTLIHPKYCDGVRVWTRATEWHMDAHERNMTRTLTLYISETNDIGPRV